MTPSFGLPSVICETNIHKILIIDTFMQAIITRKWRRDGYTIGCLTIDGQFFCHTCEDTDRNLHDFMSTSDIREIKEYGNTAIPCGKYRVLMDYSPKYKRLMPHICDVKGFEGIRIHSGNTSADSEGCVLLGVAVLDEDGIPTKDWVGSSRATCTAFEQLLTAAGSCDLEVR